MPEGALGLLDADLGVAHDRPAKSSKSKHHKKEKHKHDRKHKGEKRHKERAKQHNSESAVAVNPATHPLDPSKATGQQVRFQKRACSKSGRWWTARPTRGVVSVLEYSQKIP